MSEIGAPGRHNPGFGRFASLVAHWSGNAIAFAGAVILVIAWAAAGPIFNYSDSWQMVINTGTTICTFLMVFVIQNSQNRDGMALQAKLDELIRAAKGARNGFIGLEDYSEEELSQIRRCLHEFAQGAHREMQQDSGVSQNAGGDLQSATMPPPRGEPEPGAGGLTPPSA